MPDDWARVKALMVEHRSLEYAQARARAFGMKGAFIGVGIDHPRRRRGPR